MNIFKKIISNRVKIIKWLSLAIFLFALVLFVNLYQKKKAPEVNNNVSIENTKIRYIKIGGVTLKADIADTPEKQEQGLSGRKILGENEGMLFVFTKPSKYSFWMKDMNFPIDIIWIGEDLKVADITNNALPESYPETFTPSRDVKYVLEVISSFSEKNNLKIGDQVKFLPS